MVKLIGPKYLSECKFERSYRKNIPHHEDQNEFYYGNIYECLTPWMEKFLHLVHNYPKADDFKSITKWTTQVVFILDEILPFKKLVQFLGDKNYIFYVRVNGFVQGKENGDMTYFSPVYGMPPESHPEANGYFSKILQDYPLLGIQGLEINRSELPVN